MTRLEYMCDLIDRADGLADDELGTVALILTQMAGRRRVTRTLHAAERTVEIRQVRPHTGYRVGGASR